MRPLHFIFAFVILQALLCLGHQEAVDESGVKKALDSEYSMDRAKKGFRIPKFGHIKKMQKKTRKLFLKNKDFIPKVVRGVFHDCVGGCDACLNFGTPTGASDNSGLANIQTELNKFYFKKKFNKLVSRADYWALAGKVAINVGVELSQKSFKKDNDPSRQLCPQPCFDLWWGRQSTDDCGNSAHERIFPHTNEERDHIFGLMNQDLGMNRDETVALMGGHALGGCAPENTGFNGTWTPGPARNEFDNRFFQFMIDPNRQWVTIDRGTNRERWQYESGRPEEFMVNTDFEMFYDIPLQGGSGGTGEPLCTLNHICGLTNSCDVANGECAKAEDTFPTAQLYAEDCDAFIDDFKKAYEKMLMVGGNNLVKSKFQLPY